MASSGGRVANRVQRVMSLSRRGVREAFAAQDWASVNAWLGDLMRVSWAHRTVRARRAAPRGLMSRVGAALEEYVREPVCPYSGGEPSVRDIPLWQRSAWSSIEEIGHVGAAAIAARWVRAPRRAIRMQGAWALCALAPKAKIAEVLRLMVDRDLKVAQEAVYGASKAIERGRVTRANERRIIALWRSMISGRARAGAVCCTAEELIRCEELEFLCSPAVLRPRNRMLRRTLLALVPGLGRESASYLKSLRRRLDPEILWGLFEAWRRGEVLCSRVRHPTGTDDDQIAGTLIHLGAFVDPTRASEELDRLKRRRWGRYSMIAWSMRDAEKVIRRWQRRRKR